MIWRKNTASSEGETNTAKRVLVIQLGGLGPFVLALAAAKRALIEGDENSLALSAERDAFEALLDTTDKSEGIQAFRDRRKPEFRGT